MTRFYRVLTYAEVTALYRAATDDYRARHPRPDCSEDDELSFLYALDVANFGDNAVNEVCGDPTRHLTDQHLRYMREQRGAA